MKQITLIITLFFNIVAFNQNDTINLYFDFDSKTLTTKNKKDLQKKLKEFKNNYFKIYGYTDTIGDYQYNLSLSKHRAKVVYDYLLEIGINKEHLFYVGKGESISQNNYLDRRVDVIIVKDTTENVNSTLLLENKKIGNEFVLKNVQFYPSSDKLKEESFVHLKKFIEEIKNNNNLIIEIQGHICCNRCKPEVANDTTINDLSTMRAKTVYNYFLQNGINKNQMTYKGYSSCKPLVNEIDEKTRQMNRRIEIKIIKI